MSEHAVSDAVLGCLAGPALSGLAAQLGGIGELSAAERKAVQAATESIVLQTVRLRTNRVLLVELNAARITGRLTGADSRARWEEWEAAAATGEFWDSLAGHYPTLLPRLERLIGNRCAASLSLARRFAADRTELASVLGGPAGELEAVEFGAGDSHRGGQTVAVVRCAAGFAIYKPRSVHVDVALARLLARLLEGEREPIRVPAVVARDGYGWAEHIAHRYCADEEELRTFYRGLGHWLAVMRLIGGSDLHAENLIAAGPVSTVVDCETIFTPRPVVIASAFGQAIDRAWSMVAGSVLGTGLLPGRGLALGWRGVDMSAIGSLPGQQPTAKLPVIVDGGTDRARIEREEVPVGLAVNHPSPFPVLGKYWDQVVDGFTGLSERLRRMDAAGELEPLLAAFADLPVRVVLRNTESYAELGRMLWHPQALHDEPAARRHAADLLARQSANVPGRPDDPAVIEAEVEDLLYGDVPFFTTTPRKGRLSGPGGTAWGSPEDLIDGALTRWRAADLGVDRMVIQSGLVSAYLNEGWLPDQRSLLPSRTRADDRDRRRRELAAGIMRGLTGSAIRADDGTATWIAPVLNPTGWAVLPLGYDLYAGMTGVAVLLAAYLHESGHGRAEPVAAVPSLLEDVLRTLRKADDQNTEPAKHAGRYRADIAGGYLGLGSRIWGWLLLERLGAVGGDEAVSRAASFVPHIAEVADGDVSLDLVHGIAGAVVPLLRLGERGGAAGAGALALAARIGGRLVNEARQDGDGVWWPNSSFPDGLGGLAHGVTGIGWALARLAGATGGPEFAAVAEAAFAHEETLYAPESGGWRDLRMEDGSGIATAWCHGAAGIGIAAADLLRHRAGGRQDVVRRAAASCQADALGWNHTLCHGDLGAWELLDLAVTAGVAPGETTRDTLDAHVLSSLEEHGPISGFARDAFAPGLLPGLGGIAYQLLRMHPDSRLPSVLLPDPGPGPGPGPGSDPGPGLRRGSGS